MLAKRACQSTSLSPDTPPSRASPLPHWIGVAHKACAWYRSPCGSELARDGSGTVNITVTRHTAFASKPAPTLEWRRSQNLRLTQIPLWERACSRIGRVSQHHRRLTHRFREQARSHTGWASLTKPGLGTDPLWERACSRIGRVSQHHRCLTHRFREQARSHTGMASLTKPAPGTDPPVGAGLLAKREYQSTSSLPDTPLSRAGSLPHWNGVAHKACAWHRSPCGSGLAREEGVSVNIIAA